jgi:NCS1 family nucleobase:cation symporter-1
MLADYHIIRRHRLKLSDLYRGDSSSLYWFRSGVNWRAFVAFTAGMWPLLRMFLHSGPDNCGLLTSNV